MDGLGKGKVVGSLVLNPSHPRSLCSFLLSIGKKDDLDADFYVLILHGCAHSFLHQHNGTHNEKEMKVFLFLSWVRFPKNGGLGLNGNDL